MKMEKIFIATVFVLGITIFSTNEAYTQEALKQEALDQLQTMTPDQIDAKLKEYGISREEAEAKAKELGIDINQYIQARGSAAAPVESVQTAPQIQGPTPQQNVQQLPAPVAPPAQELEVPGFQNRNGMEGIHPFGYDLFNYPSTTFEPVLSIPTPANYIIGPDDQLDLTMWGETQMFQQLDVDREGEVIIPNVGPILAQGLTVEKLKEKIIHRMTAVYSGLKNGQPGANTWLDLSVGKLRSIQIFVLGEVDKPGGYTVTSLSNAMLGLYVAGGPNVKGTLRDIQILRDNKVISTLDVYDFALHGDKSRDIRLQDGDVIFVKPAGRRVAIVGHVIRPAIYELKDNETLGDLLSLAGGLEFNAYFNTVHVERIIPFSERKDYNKNILDIDVRFSSVDELRKSDFKLVDGDIVTIRRVNDLFENRAILAGNVKKPGVYSLSPGMRVKDLIEQAGGYLEDTFEDRATIIRVLQENQKKEVIPFNLGKAMAGDSTNNVLLATEDSVIVYSKKYFFPEHTVIIGGEVQNPDTVVRFENMTVSDLIVASGGLTENALRGEVYVTRVETTSTSIFARTFRITQSKDYWRTDTDDDFELKDFDYVRVPPNPKFHKDQFVDVRGEVMYPGRYVILYDGERVYSVIKRAGGLRDKAYLQGSKLIRSKGDAGLVPINFVDAITDSSSESDIEVADGDTIIIGRDPKVVYVRGEVGVPSAVVYESGASLSYYLDQAGGVKDDGDDGRIVVTLPSGKKWRRGWFIFPSDDILSGSTVYVPIKIEHENTTLPVLRDWATIMASMAAITIGIVEVTK
jgi:polysaccharide biosynthesis/export protein